MADEYDAAQDRGEVAKPGGDKSKLPDGNFATVAEIGLTHKDIHEARLIRDAEGHMARVTLSPARYPSGAIHKVAQH